MYTLFASKKKNTQGRRSVAAPQELIQRQEHQDIAEARPVFTQGKLSVKSCKKGVVMSNVSAKDDIH